jgi:hypothetical protein
MTDNKTFEALETSLNLLATENSLLREQLALVTVEKCVLEDEKKLIDFFGRKLHIILFLFCCLFDSLLT